MSKQILRIFGMTDLSLIDEVGFKDHMAAKFDS